jgi:myosin heavy subunit
VAISSSNHVLRRFINLQVHPESGNLIGANIETLLLEVCRLSSRPVMERNFHVFYYLLAPSLSDDVKMLQSNVFVSDIGAGQTALLGADLDQIDVAEDSKNLITLLNAFRLLDFSQLEISFVFSIVAACLHLKELKFFESDRVVKVRSGSDSFEFACELLGVSVDKLKEQIMSKSIRVMGQSASLQNLDLASCQASLTSLIATLYSSLFDWLMRKINATLGCAPSSASLNLGILDIVGFESEKNNGFSQLFFNYGCEKIQQLFLGKAILEEIELYQSEGLSDVKIDVANNDPIVQFYEDKTYGLFAILDAQSRLAGGTDDGFLQILLQNLSNSSAPSYIMGHRVYDRSAKSDSSFIIKHHSAPVSYNVNGLLMANKETHLRDDLIDALRTSSFAQLLQILPNATQSASIGGPVKVAAKHVGTSARFRDQLLDLTQRLRESHCHFIRCFSPNTEGNPESFHGTHMLTQLRSSGIFEAVSLRMRGFPFRKSHEQFLSMYRSLIASQSSMTPKLRCRKIITNVFIRGDGVHVGEHMVCFQSYFCHTAFKFNVFAGFLQAFAPQDSRGSVAKSRVWSSSDDSKQFSFPHCSALRSKAAPSSDFVQFNFAAPARLEVGRSSTARGQGNVAAVCRLSDSRCFGSGKTCVTR